MSFGRTRLMQPPSGSALRRPFLARPEVVDVAEDDVSHRSALGDGEREREERDAALRVHGAVDRIDDDAQLASASEPPFPELLGDEHEVLVERGEPLDDGVLRRLVDRRRVVAPLTQTQHRLAHDARRQSLEGAAAIRDAQPAGLEPGGHRSSGWKTRPDSGLGVKYVLFAGIRSPRRATAKASSTRGARTTNATSASPRSTAAIASLALDV